jgi:1,2-diacylglycerol 3-alpha-glucosyltransferase
MTYQRHHRLAIVCCGMERVRRGYEVYAKDLFELLKADSVIEVTLIKGGGRRTEREQIIPNLFRDSTVTRLLCGLFGHQRKLFIEFLSFSWMFILLGRVHQYDALYVLEASVYKHLHLFRRLTGGKYKLIHFTGGQMQALPATRLDYIHHVTPCFTDAALKCGFAPGNQFFVPHFIHWPAGEVDQALNASNKIQLRARLGIREGMKIVLSVGAIDAHVKRMDYVIRECSRLSREVFLLMLGNQDTASQEINSLALQLLGTSRYRILSVNREEIGQYYSIADVFVLASLREGFGLVFLEALAFGLPIITHDHEVARFVMEDYATFADLRKDGQLTMALERELAKPVCLEAAKRRMDFVQKTYSRENLKEAYCSMIRTVCDA